MKHRQQRGIALITALLVLLLMSTMIVGLAWLVMSDQKLGGNNSDRQLAFYGAEAGMEAMTANLENLFDANYAPTSAQINAIPGNTSTNLVPGVQFLAPGSTTNGSGLSITFNSVGGIPFSSYETIPTGSYAGLVGLASPYTLTVTAHTNYGSEVKLQREVQTVEIPVFQFGVFCQGDCGFHSGTNFTFGGRVHANGNLWLAAGTGATLQMSDKVTAAHEIVLSTLMNGLASSASWTGPVDITNGSSYKQLTIGSINGNNWNIQTLAAAENTTPPGYTYNSTFSTTASSTFNNYIGVLETGVKPLNIAIATPAIGGQSIDLIRRPQPGEATAKLVERYYDKSGVSLRILLSDYGSDGTCATSDISSTNANGLPGLAANGTGSTITPADLATLAWDTAAPHTSGNNYPPYYQAPAGLTAANVGYTVFPLPVSAAESSTVYTKNDGYWLQEYYPIVRGCLKIEYQSTAGTWTDVTWDILNLGFTGRNIDPQINAHTVPAYATPTGNGWEEPNLAAITQEVAAQGPTIKTGIQTVGCQDPSPYAVLRFARLRDNPSTAASTNDYCGNNEDPTGGTPLETNGSWSGTGHSYTTACTSTTSTNCPSQLGTDYWPNVLFDSREGTLRDFDTTSNTYTPTLAGAMYYVELDAANLGKCLTATTAPYSTYCSWATNAAGTNGVGYAVYFSDRRDEQTDPAPPASVGGSNNLTGGYGYEDFINPANANGCPNNALDQGEDLESDYNSNGVSLTPTQLRTYGNILNPPSPRTAPTGLWPDRVNGVYPTYTQLGTVSNLESAVLENNANCSGPALTWPFAQLKINAGNGEQDLRENPPVFFRRALKLVDGSSISLGAAHSCNTVNCGLTIASENPVYIQGDWNNNPNTDATFATPSTDTHVATAVIADAVTLLSDSWNDVNSFSSPYDWTMRTATSTTYRVAIAAGKGIGFPNPGGGAESDEGTDGGVHNFVRYLENWGGGTTSYYLGSMVNFWYSHQGYGMFKCCDGAVYNPPARSYAFDTDFLTPDTLPPLTPMLLDVNTVGFSQMILPTQ